MGKLELIKPEIRISHRMLYVYALTLARCEWLVWFDTELNKYERILIICIFYSYSIKYISYIRKLRSIVNKANGKKTTLFFGGYHFLGEAITVVYYAYNNCIWNINAYAWNIYI